MSRAGIEGERDVSPAASTRKPFITRKQMLLAVAAVASLVVAYAFWRGEPATKEQQKGPVQTRIAAEVPYEAPKMPAPPPLAPPRPEPVSMPLVPPPPAFLQHPVQALQAEIKQKPARPEPDMISYADPSESASHVASAKGSDPAGGDSETQVAFKGSVIAGDKAGLIGDQNFVLMPGLVSCVLDTAIDSTLPGPVQCHLEGDAKSPTGVTLLDRGTVITGQYKNDLNTGQARLFTQADLIRTPFGCMVQVDHTPMTDALGRNGLDGGVDNHYLSRFGAGVLLSLVDSGLGILQSAVSKGGNTYVSFQSGDMSSLAQTILRSTINQPPTITKNQGDRIAVFVLKPIDFSGCYQLRVAPR
jgi:type IV secretion system protein VirB10